MSENNLLLILGALVGRARPKIWWIYIYQIRSADCKTPFGMSKNYLEVILSNSKESFNKKPNSTIQHRKWMKITYFWFWVYCLIGHPPKSCEYTFTKFGRLTGRHPLEGAKIILRLLFLTRRRVSIKNQTAIPHSEKWRKWLIFDSGCTGWQSIPQNLVSINLPNLVGWLGETLRKEQKLFWSYSF